MRTLTLDQKISIKGELARYGVLASILLELDLASALGLYWANVGKPLATYCDPRRWRKNTKRPAGRSV